MGLDQFMVAVKSHKDNTDFAHAYDEFDDSTCIALAKWRKHPNLEGWMTDLYNAKMKAQGKEGITERKYWSESNTVATVTPLNKDGTTVVDEEASNMIAEIQEAINKAHSQIKEIAMEEGSDDVYMFNNQMLRLTISDLEQLETAVVRGELPPTSGFFFGDNADEKYKEQDLKFIQYARKAIENGKHIYYCSSW